MTEEDETTYGDPNPQEPPPDLVVAVPDRSKLAPAIPTSMTVASVGAVPDVPDGLGGGSDGD
jgi:hypothetical protein